LSSCNPTFTYSWSPTNYVQSPSNCDTKFYPISESSYVLTFTDSNSCVSKDTFNIHLASLQQGIIWENMTQCNGGKPTVRLRNPSTGPLNYFWTFGDGTSSSTDASPIHEYSKGGSFPVVVNIYNEYCSETATDIINIAPVNIPNLFTPNADTHNDCFEITGLYTNWHVEVYNRWSKCIFKSDNYQNDFCGDDLSSGVYFYLVCPPYGDCCKSWVEITNDTK
jgi:gliding motility-associated-like protein